MRVLGLGAGNPGGSAEILLSLALAAAADEGARRDLVRLDELTLPTRPVGPADGDGDADDDGAMLWNQVMDSDGLIVSAPIYSRTVPGRLKLVADRLSGPAADVAFAESYRAMLEAGEEPPVAFPYDERVFRPRVAGLIAVGGALTSQWKSLALPLMHQMTFSSHMAVADQLLVGGAGMPRAVVLDDAALSAAERVGHSVGSQLGRAFEDVQYRGEPGLCPLCHLSAVTISGTEVECPPAARPDGSSCRTARRWCASTIPPAWGGRSSRWPRSAPTSARCRRRRRLRARSPGRSTPARRATAAGACPPRSERRCASARFRRSR